MSWWIRERTKNGQTHLWAVDIDPLAVMILVGLGSAILYPVMLPVILSLSDPRYLVASILLYGGIYLVVIAKVSVYRKGIWTSWGTRNMTRNNARIYLTGYCLALVGVTILVVLRSKA